MYFPGTWCVKQCVLEVWCYRISTDDLRLAVNSLPQRQPEVKLLSSSHQKAYLILRFHREVPDMSGHLS